MTEQEKIIRSEHELMTALIMFFAVFWSGEGKFRQIVIRSRENSLEAQTRVSIDFQDHKELWNMVIQDYLKSTGSRAEKDTFVREELRLLLGGTQKKRYEKLLEKMPGDGLEIEEDIIGFGRTYYVLVFKVEASSAHLLVTSELLERDGKFLGRASVRTLPVSVIETAEKIVKTFQGEKVFGKIQLEFAHIPEKARQTERVVVLGTELLPATGKLLEEKLATVVGADFVGDRLILDSPEGTKVLAFLLDQDTQVKNDAVVPYYLQDLKFTTQEGRGLVFSTPEFQDVVPEFGILYFASGVDETRAYENLLLLYEQALGLSRDPKAREKLLGLKH